MKNGSPELGGASAGIESRKGEDTGFKEEKLEEPLSTT